MIQKHKDVAFRISTNGTILDQEILDALKGCGNLVVFLSLEGLEADTDAWRGPAVYGKILETMATLKRERILFGFSLLFHAKNFADTTSERFLDTMRDAGCKFGLYFPYGPIGDNARYDLALSEEQIQSIFAQLTALEDKYSMLLLKEGYLAPATSRNYLLEQGCRAGVTIHITPEGNVEPCNGIQFYAVNVFEQGLEQVFQSPFYKDIYACAERKGKHCVGMFSPQEVLEIVRRNNANNSHPRALDAYSEYSQFHLGRISANKQSGQKALEG
jgi:MoaA/NifB/PqqE/SkfB family radical SAM enzyme